MATIPVQVPTTVRLLCRIAADHHVPNVQDSRRLLSSRWEADRIPKVRVVKINKIKEQSVYMPQIPDIMTCPENLLPLKQWEDSFLADFSELRLVDNGEWEVYPKVTALCIGNVKYFGGGMNITPNAHPFSGNFQDFKWYDFVLKLHKLYNGTPIGDKRIFKKGIEIEDALENDVEINGEDEAYEVELEDVL